MKRLFFLVWVITSLTACSNQKEDDEKTDVNLVYFDYKIRGEEESNIVTVLLYYHYNRPGGKTFIMKAPGNVQLDGEMLKADSTPLGGFFYEMQKPVETFTGKHSIQYTTPDKKKYLEDFWFAPFILTTEIPPVIKRQDWKINISGSKEGAEFLIIATDTNFASSDINIRDTLRRSQLVIERNELQNLMNGPIALEIYQVQDLPVQKGTKVGGRIVIEYGLKRETELTD